MKSFTIPTIFSAIDKFTAPVNRMSNSVSAFASRTQRDFRNAGQGAMALGRSAGMMGLAVVAPLGLMAKTAVEFEDRMSDVSKTTGLTGIELEKFSADILKMSKRTRTSIEDLQSISEIGGQLGIAKKDLLGFVDAGNKFNVALGKDFEGGVEEAITSVGKMATLFKDTKSLDISTAIMATGSAINQLGAMGAGTSSNISEFTLRMGALPSQLKDTATNTIALGTYFEELGIDARIAAGGMTNLLLVAGEQIGGFAKQMGLSEKVASKLLSTDPSEFAKKFASSFKGMAPDKLAQKLKDLKVGTQETIKVIGALGNNQERLTYLQKESGKAFGENTSLINEYNVKNSNSAANLAKLKNNAMAVSITLGTALLPVINNLVEKIVPFIDRISNWISENKKLTTTILKVVLGFGAFALAVSGVSFAFGIYQKAMVLARASSVLFSGGLSIVKTGLLSAKMATIGLNGALMLTPFGLIVAGLAAISLAAYGVYSAYNKVSDSQRLNDSIRKNALSNSIDERIEVTKLLSVLKTTSDTSEKYNNALKRLDEISPNIVKKYDLQYSSLRNLAQAEKDLIYQIMKRAKVQAHTEMYTANLKQIEQNKMEGPGLLNKAVNLFGAKSTFDQEQDQLKADNLKLQKMIIEDQGGKPTVNPKKTNQESLLNTVMQGNIKSDVLVTINGAPSGTTATATSTPIWMPTTGNTRGK